MASKDDTDSVARQHKAITIEQIQDEADFGAFFDCMRESFGLQARDPFWLDMHPGYDTSQGKADSVERLVKRFRKVRGSGHTWFLKAVVRDTDSGEEQMGGVAIWTEASETGNPQSKQLSDAMDVSVLYPNDEARQRFLAQIFASFMRRRNEVIAEVAAEKPNGSIMVLDVCCVRPSFQRRGLARKLVQWGLDLAAQRREGGLECFTEASRMGRSVYTQMGFEVDREVVYKVDSEFAHLPTTPNTTLRRPRQSVLDQEARTA